MLLLLVVLNAYMFINCSWLITQIVFAQSIGKDGWNPLPEFVMCTQCWAIVCCYYTMKLTLAKPASILGAITNTFTCTVVSRLGKVENFLFSLIQANMKYWIALTLSVTQRSAIITSDAPMQLPKHHWKHSSIGRQSWMTTSVICLI